MDPAHCSASALATICALRNADPTVTAQKLAAGAKPEDLFQTGPGPVLGTLPETYLIVVKAQNVAETCVMSQTLKRTASGWESR